MCQPLKRAEVAKAFLDAFGVVETIDVRKHCLPGLFSGLEATQGMNKFFLQYREETLAPGIVARHAYAGEALFQTQLSLNVAEIL